MFLFYKLKHSIEHSPSMIKNGPILAFLNGFIVLKLFSKVSSKISFKEINVRVGTDNCQIIQ